MENKIENWRAKHNVCRPTLIYAMKDGNVSIILLLCVLQAVD